MTSANGSGLRVAVVGATGNVGTSLVETLSRDPAVREIIAIARRRPDWHPAKTRWVTADTVTADLARIFDGADAVVHLAWLFQPTHDPNTTWRVNVIGGRRVFAAAATARVDTLVYASSVGAYSPGPKDHPVDEGWPTDGWPTAGYTREKAYLERALDAFERQQPQMRVVRLRPGFIFKRESASEQRRLFAGPFLPGSLVRPGFIPVVPDVPGLRFQAMHTRDAAEAYRLALLRDVRGAFNIAADPVVDTAMLADIFRARPVRLPISPVRAAVALAWSLRLVPASPHLLDAVLRLPLMSTERARGELGWTPRYTSREALEEFLAGLRTAGGMPTAPLSPRIPGGRPAEVRTAVGQWP